MLFTSKGSLAARRDAEPNFHRRIVNTLLLLLLFRLLANIPALNVDEERIHELLAKNPLLGALDLFAGGEVLAKFSVVAVGIFPYLFAAVPVRVAATIIPAWRELERAGGDSQKRFDLYTKLATVPLAFVFAWGVMHELARQTGLFPQKIHWFTGGSFWLTLRVVGIITLGSLASAAITDRITKQGVGPGESVVLLAASSLAFVTRLSDIVHGGGGTAAVLRALAGHALVALSVVIFAIYIMTAQRRVPVRSMHRLKSGVQNHLPLLLNHGGIVPISSAAGLLLLLKIGRLFLEWMFPGRFPALGRGLDLFTGANHAAYWAALAALVIAFTYLCNFLSLWRPFSNSDRSLAENLRRTGTFIPGLRPGSQTENYLTGIVTRLTLPAALALAFLAAGLPWLILKLTGEDVTVAILAIIVFVQTVDALRREITAYRLMESYDDFLRK